jgi:hypothetical protein
MMARGQAYGGKPSPAHAPGGDWHSSLHAFVDAARAAFERSKILQSAVDVGAVAGAILIVNVTALSIVGSLFILFCMETP